MGDLAGTTVVVTGANTGVGRATAEALGARRATVWLACRDVVKAEPVAAAIERAGGVARLLQLDLADLGSVRRAADRFAREAPRLDVLVNNAGLGGARGVTKDGFELAFGTNHLGPFLFTLLLMPKLEASAPSRVVNVASDAHYRAGRIDWAALRRPTRTLTGFPEYCVSKLANVLFTSELARRLGQGRVTTYAAHPGVVATDIWRRVPALLRRALTAFMLTPDDGARTSLHCATAPELAAVSGRYYERCAERTPSRAARDDDLARELWERSAAWSAAPDLGPLPPPE